MEKRAKENSITRDEKTDLLKVKDEVSLWRATNVHLCPRFQASPQAIKGVFATPLTLTFDVRQTYVWLALVPVSNASSNMSEIWAKGVEKAR